MVYIDMDMPECCDKCFALDDIGDYPLCRITHSSRGYNFDTRSFRMDDCPLKNKSDNIYSDEKDKMVKEIDSLRQEYVSLLSQEIMSLQQQINTINCAHQNREIESKYLYGVGV